MAATSDTSYAKHPKPQYHHFIPRFILRNFEHPRDQLKTSSKQSRKDTRRSKNRPWKNNEPVIYAVDLSKPTAEIVERPISRTFGMTDMYRDFGNYTNQHYLEEELSKLESRAAQTVTKMRKHFEEGKTEVWITRPERNVLRKFLFIMKYRSSGMHKRFFHQNGQGYLEDDREKLLRYMEEKGFKKPIDVWFDNIKGMLDLKMDVNDDWIQNFPTRIYPDDAKWFIAHTQMMYLALCTPANKDDEFLLTENAYGIYEGPSSVLQDPNTGEFAVTRYTEFHKFAAISPNLMMVLRSFLLPVPEEDLHEEVKTFRNTMFIAHAEQHNNPSTVVSTLADLPVTKPRNSYSKIVDGRLELLDGRVSGLRRVNDKFCFRFFPLETVHVNKINAIMLEESHSISNIVFRSQTGLRRAIEFYLTMPFTQGFKRCTGTAGDPRLSLLKKLEQLVNVFGSKVTAVYTTNNQGLLSQEQYIEEHEDAWAQILEEVLPKEPTELMKLYLKLGGSPKTILKDMDQARRMLNMRIKIDVFTKGLDEDFREGVREQVRVLFCQLPPRRVWQYLKQVRNMLLRDRTIGPKAKIATDLEDNWIMDGPENSIALVSHIFGNTTALCRLMWHSTLQNISMIKNPDINFDTTITLNEEGARRMNLQRRIFFGKPGNENLFMTSVHLGRLEKRADPLQNSGSICDCGILIVEESAKFCKDIARSIPYLEEVKNPVWKMEENIEMITRCMVRDGFADLMGSKLSAVEFKALDQVLFEVVYPTTPGRTF